MTNYLEVTNLSKSFDSFQLHNISFTLPKGYIMGLIGPNGSGKTTTIKLILNMLKRTGGTVKVMGLDNIAEEQKVKSELGVVFDTNYFSDDWKVSQVEKSISVFYPNWDSQKFADMLRKFHIVPTKKVKELSKGMQMKLMLACAFSYDAKLLILDEPTSGLDPVSRDELLKILSEYIEDGEHSVLFSTHITGDLERAADYITYISYGELFYTGSKDDFVDFKILLIIVTFLACKHYNFINGGRLNSQVGETVNIFGFHQCLKSRRECTNTSRLIFQIIGQFLNSTFYNAEHIYKIIFAASKVQLAITDVGNIIGCTLQIACDMGGEQNTMLAIFNIL